MFNNIFCYATYMAYTTYMFNNICRFLNNIYVLFKFNQAYISNVSLNNMYVILR